MDLMTELQLRLPNSWLKQTCCFCSVQTVKPDRAVIMDGVLLTLLTLLQLFTEGKPLAIVL